MLAKTKKKPSEKEASGDGDGFEAILSVGVGESTSLNMQRKSPRMARMKYKFAGSKKKTSKAATSISEEPPSPEAGGRKCPPEQSVALEKQKGKVTTLWQRGKPKRVVVSDVPTRTKVCFCWCNILNVFVFGVMFKILIYTRCDVLNVTYVQV